MKARAQGANTALVEHIRRILHDPATAQEFRQQATDWARRRVLTFEVVVMMILQGHKHAFADTLGRVFHWMGALLDTPSSSALCQARHKLKPELFLYLTQVTAQDFYQRPPRELSDVEDSDAEDSDAEDSDAEDSDAEDSDAEDETWGEAQTYLVWHGHRVLAVDGTKWTLPNTAVLREVFGAATNQHTTTGVAQAQGLVLFDVLNDIGLHAVMAPTQGGKVASEKAILFDSLTLEPALFQFLEHTWEGDVLTLDRNYGAYSVLAFLRGHNRHFLIRMTRSSFKAVRDFWQQCKGYPSAEAVVTIPVTPDQKKFVREHDLPLQVKVRLVKLTLPNGEEEVLATSLLDSKQYPRWEIGEIYRQRWNIEGYIDRLKNIWEVERLGVRRLDHLLQDFYGVLFLSTLESVLIRGAQRNLEQYSQDHPDQHPQQVNRVRSYTALVDHTLALLLDDSKDVSTVLSELQFLFLRDPTVVRTGRSYARKKRNLSSQLHHQMYAKRALT